MKALSKIVLLVIAMFLITGTAFTQVTASATATATILTPIAISNVDDMNFGNLAVNNTPGTIVLTPQGARTATGGVTFLPSNAGTITAASFTVTGLAAATYSITLPAAATVITNGVDNMTVDTWTSDPTPTGTLTGGSETLNVGATLNVPGSSSFGVYFSATPFNVTVNYN